MKLSEAIRLGAMIKPQTRNGYADENGSCALLAASEAMGIPPIDYFDPLRSCERPIVDYFALESRFPILRQESVCPAIGESYVCRYATNVLQVAYHLNDSHGLTREQIADWVETIEKRNEPAIQIDQLTEAQPR